MPTAIVDARPAGISKSKTASLTVPLFSIVKGFPYVTVLTVPTSTVAARPPGISKFNIASVVVPVLVTVGVAPNRIVSTVPIAISPVSPLSPLCTIFCQFGDEGIVPAGLFVTFNLQRLPIYVTPSFSRYEIPEFHTPLYSTNAGPVAPVAPDATASTQKES